MIYLSGDMVLDWLSCHNLRQKCLVLGVGEEVEAGGVSAVVESLLELQLAALQGRVVSEQNTILSIYSKKERYAHHMML